MGPIPAIKLGVLNTFKISSRSKRPEFWWFLLIGLTAICLIVYVATSTPPLRPLSDLEKSVLFANFRLALLARLGALSVPSLCGISLIALMLFTACIRRFNDIGWPRFVSVLFLVVTISLIASVVKTFLAFEPTDRFLALTQAAYESLIGYDVDFGTAILLTLCASPLLLMILIADMLLLLFGGLVLMFVALSMTVLLMGLLAFRSAPASTPNEVPS